MPDNDKTLSQTIRQVMTEPVKASEPVVGQTGKELSQAVTGETQSEGTPEYVNGVDISTFSEQERPVARKALEEKGKLLETGYQKKFSEIAEFKRQREEILRMGISETEAVEAIRNHVASKTNAKDAKKEASRVIDQLKESAPDLQTRQGLENLEKIIKEQTNIDEINKKLTFLENYVNHNRGREFQTREQTLNSSLSSLEKEYGKDIINKYGDELVRQGLIYIDVDPERLLHIVSDPKELKQAILSNGTKKNERTQEKINAVSSPSSGMTSPAQAVDIRKTPMKGIMALAFAKK